MGVLARRPSFDLSLRQPTKDFLPGQIGLLEADHKFEVGSRWARPRSRLCYFFWPRQEQVSKQFALLRSLGIFRAVGGKLSEISRSKKAFAMSFLLKDVLLCDGGIFAYLLR